MALEVRGVSKIIKGKRLINNVSFQINTGEITGLLGHNGTGKTTTMRMIMGLMSMSAGDVVINGHSIKHQREQALRGIGGMIETPGFYPYMSGMDNLKYYSLLSESSELNINEVAEALGLEQALNKKVQYYSLGMRQRLGIIQALLHRPSVLILDEPFNGLDPTGIKALRTYLQQLSKEQNVAMLISSHIISEIELLCNKVLFMKDGELLDSYNLQENNPFNHTIRVIYLVEDASIAAVVLNSFIDHSTYNLDIANNKVIIEMRKDQIPQTLRYFLDHGVNVYEVLHEKEALEDRFLSATGGSTIA